MKRAVTILGACALAALTIYGLTSGYRAYKDAMSLALSAECATGAENPWTPGSALAVLHKMNSRQFDALYLCDSVMFTAQPDGKGSMADVLGSNHHYRVLPVAGPGFSPLLFRHYLKLASLARFKPPVLIVGVNPRSFSDNWVLDPRYRYDEFSRFFETYLHAVNFSDYLAQLACTSDCGYPRLQRGLWADALERDRRYFEKNNDEKKRLLALMEQTPEENRGTRIHFINNYATTIRDDHPMFEAIRDMAREAKQLGIPLVLYVTPFDHEDLRALCGPDAAAVVEANVAAVAAFIKGVTPYALDLSHGLGRAEFPDAVYANEHLTPAGQAYIAGELAKLLPAIRKPSGLLF